MQNGEELEGAQPGHPDASGTWRAEFVTTKDLPPDDRFEVRAVCYSRPGVVGFTYEPQPFDARS